MIIMYMWKQCCAGFIVVYMYCHWEGWDPIKQFNPVTFGSIPKPVPRFQRHMQWSFYVQLIQLRWEAIVGFVDIGEFDDHRCLKFLFIFVIYIVPRLGLQVFIWNNTTWRNSTCISPSRREHRCTYGKERFCCSASL